MRVTKFITISIVATFLLAATPPTRADEVNTGPIGVGYGTDGSQASYGYASCSALGTACAGVVVATTGPMCAHASGTIDFFSNDESAFTVCSAAVGIVALATARAIIDAQVRTDVSLSAISDDDPSGHDGCAWYDTFCNGDGAHPRLGSIAKISADGATTAYTTSCNKRLSALPDIGKQISCNSTLLYFGSGRCVVLSGAAIGRSTIEQQAAGASRDYCDHGTIATAGEDLPLRDHDRVFPGTPLGELPSWMADPFKEVAIDRIASIMANETEGEAGLPIDEQSFRTVLQDAFDRDPTLAQGTVTVYVDGA